MLPDEFERRMRRLEWFHSLRCPTGMAVILRLDGRGFTRFTADGFEKPFDARFHEWMVQTAQALLDDLGGTYAYTESDEISVLLPRAWDLFDRELEKAVSLSAGLASATFTLAAGRLATFDSRALLCALDEQVIDYFRWRQADATRCALNGWSYWTLRTTGSSVAEATRALEGASTADKNELLFRNGINFNDLPTWQRRGTGLYWQSVVREGYDPSRGCPTTTTRQRITVDRELPLGAEYAALIGRIVAEGLS